jgi:Family of unknown function (DUF6308)
MPYTDYTGPDERIVQDAKRRLAADLATPGLDKLVAAYFGPQGWFAGHTFDRIGHNPANEISCDDLLAVTLLDVQWKPRAVRQLLDERSGAVTGLLPQIGSGTNLWEATAGELRAVDDRWALLCSLPGIQDAVASKLLARKRPRLAPITDSVIVAAVGARGQTWPTLRRCLQDEAFRKSIEDLRPGREAEDVSLLRIFDVALWMLYSGSEAARGARQDAGL